MTKAAKTLLNCISVLLIVACGRSEGEPDDPKLDLRSDTAESSERPGFTSSPAASPIWVYDHNISLPKQNREVDPDTLTAKGLINLINSTKGGGEVRIELVKISDDTIFTEIHNAKVLTQQMGSAGADDYLSTSTYTLTELKNLKYVHYNFKVGDHASPGTYSREYYLKRYERNQRINVPQNNN